jgi:hypothetical protein
VLRGRGDLLDVVRGAGRDLTDPLEDGTLEPYQVHEIALTA